MVLALRISDRPDDRPAGRVAHRLPHVSPGAVASESSAGVASRPARTQPRHLVRRLGSAPTHWLRRCELQQARSRTDHARRRSPPVQLRQRLCGPARARHDELEVQGVASSSPAAPTNEINGLASQGASPLHLRSRVPLRCLATLLGAKLSMPRKTGSRGSGSGCPPARTRARCRGRGGAVRRARRRRYRRYRAGRLPQARRIPEGSRS